MPVSITSRYTNAPIYDATDAQGESHPTVAIRPSTPPAPGTTLAIRPSTPPAPGTTLYQHILIGAETMEYLAWRYYGSSSSWWRIAEANPLVFPLDPPAGAAIAIPSAGDVGRIERTRRF